MGSIRRFQPGRSPFDAIRHVTDDGFEYWSAREMAEELNYSRWEDVEQLIRRAKIACRNSTIAQTGRQLWPNARRHPRARRPRSANA